MQNKDEALAGVAEDLSDEAAASAAEQRIIAQSERFSAEAKKFVEQGEQVDGVTGAFIMFAEPGGSCGYSASDEIPPMYLVEMLRTIADDIELRVLNQRATEINTLRAMRNQAPQ